MRGKFYLLIFLITIITLTSCSKKQHYESLVERELASGVRNDTLFLGLTLGMTSESFYKKCWDLNKQGLIRQGSGNTSVAYEMKEELKFIADVNFYPSFFEDKIYEMPVQFKYKAWAPWNKQMGADSLQVDILSLFESWYGNGFFEISPSERKKAYVKVDGNRRISIYKDPIDDGTVWALYTDLSKEDDVKALKIKE